MTMTTAEEKIDNDSSSSSIGKKSSTSEDEKRILDDSQNINEERSNNNDSTLRDHQSENSADTSAERQHKEGAANTKGKEKTRKPRTRSRRRRQRQHEDSSFSSSCGGDEEEEANSSSSSSSSSSESESSAENVDVAKLQVMARRRIARAKSERILVSPEPQRNHVDTNSTTSGLLSRLSLSFNASTPTDDGDNLLLMGLTKKVQRLEKEKQDLENVYAEQEALHMAKIKALESGTDLQEARSQLEDSKERINTLEAQQTAWAQQVADLEKKLQDRQATIDQLRIEHPAPGIEPNVYRDLREEVAAAHSLIKTQSEHIEKLSSYASFQHENESKDLHTRVSELEMELAKSEFVWKEKISKNSEDYRKQIDHWKIQANNWKIRFEQVWSDHHQEEQAKAGHGDMGKSDLVNDASTTTTTMTSPGPKVSLTSDNVSPTSAEDQARFLAAAMGKPNALLKRGWGWG